MGCNINHFGNMSVLFDALSEFEYIISHADFRKIDAGYGEFGHFRLWFDKIVTIIFNKITVYTKLLIRTS